MRHGALSGGFALDAYQVLLPFTHGQIVNNKICNSDQELGLPKGSVKMFTAQKQPWCVTDPYQEDYEAAGAPFMWIEQCQVVLQLLCINSLHSPKASKTQHGNSA